MTMTEREKITPLLHQLQQQGKEIALLRDKKQITYSSFPQKRLSLQGNINHSKDEKNRF
jgi:hypothetical protein